MKKEETMMTEKKKDEGWSGQTRQDGFRRMDDREEVMRTHEGNGKVADT